MLEESINNSIKPIGDDFKIEQPGSGIQFKEVDLLDNAKELETLYFVKKSQKYVLRYFDNQIKCTFNIVLNLSKGKLSVELYTDEWHFAIIGNTDLKKYTIYLRKIIEQIAKHNPEIREYHFEHLDSIYTIEDIKKVIEAMQKEDLPMKQNLLPEDYFRDYENWYAVLKNKNETLLQRVKDINSKVGGKEMSKKRQDKFGMAMWYEFDKELKSDEMKMETVETSLILRI